MADIAVDQESASGVIDPMGGANQTRVRAYNERLVLSLVRRHGSLSKAEIARRTGLSAQTVSVIMRALEKDGLLKRGSPQRGRVRPAVDPDEPEPRRCAVRSASRSAAAAADLILMDFTGKVRHQLHEAYRYPTPSGRTGALPRPAWPICSPGWHRHGARSGLAGLGVALPFELWNWVEEMGAPGCRHGGLAACRYRSSCWLSACRSPSCCRMTPPPPAPPNSPSAMGRAISDFAYFFVGSFVGGGVVLNHALSSRPHRQCRRLRLDAVSQASATAARTS